MTATRSSAGHHTLDGTIRVFLAEALILPAGLVTTAVLTRKLGTAGYGLFTLAATLVAWIEWTTSAMFGRATNQCISAAPDWRPVATTVVWLQLAVGCVGAVGVALLAGPIAGVLGEPRLATYLRLFALDIPIFSLARAHGNILVGTGGFRHRAKVSAGRWVARLVLIVVLVELGFSIPGAIVASIGASVVELVVAWYYVRPPYFGATFGGARQLCVAAGPLFLTAISLRLFDKLDLFLLKFLGATAAQAGLYGVAQNLTVVPGLFALAFSPLLLATLTRLVRNGQVEHAQAMSRDSLRLVILLLPFAGVAAGSAGEIVRFVAGPAYGAATPLLQRLIVAAAGLLVISVGTAILTAFDKPQWTIWIGVPVVGLAVAGHLWAIPRWGAVGAATVTTMCAWIGAMLALAIVAFQWRIVLPVGSVARSAVLSGVAYAVAVAWPVAGAMVLVKLLGLAGLVALSYLALGEFNARERALAWSLIPWRKGDA